MRTMRRHAVRAVTAATFTASALGACGDVDDVTKAGGPAEPVELVLTNNDGGGGLDVVPAIVWFIDRVAELSDGHLVIRFEPADWATDGREVAAVAAGDADLGWIGTRGLDLVGVDEFRPLHAPLLIDSYELQAEVVRSDVGSTMLASLGRLGVEPLALLADELLLPAAVATPILSSEDWAGSRMWLLESDAYADAVEALGGTPLHTFASGGDVRKMLQEGDADGLASMWVYYSLGADYQHAPYITSNVSLGPRTLALFANPGSLAGLDDTQRAWIRQAAVEAAEWAADHADDGVARHIDDTCRNGARIAVASPEDLVDLRETVEPFYAVMRDDAATAELFAGIEVIKAHTPAGPTPDIPDACRYERGEEKLRAPLPVPLDGPGATGDFPRGTYRYTLTSEEIAIGQETLGRSSMVGVFTWTMGDGEWTVTATPSTPGVQPVSCTGWFSVEGDTAVFTYSPLPAVRHCVPTRWTARWTAADGIVSWDPPEFAILRPHFGLKHWQRID